jgi:hypothetical protein
MLLTLLVYQLGSDEIIEVKCIRKVLIKSKFRRNVFFFYDEFIKINKKYEFKKKDYRNNSSE